MKKMVPVFVACLFVASSISYEAGARSYKDIAPENPLTWPRSSSSDFGCMMEKKLGSRDVTYNCSTKHVRHGDPCTDTDNYYAGPVFPPKLLNKISPLVENIELLWEHAELQSVMIDFNRQMTKDDIEKVLGIALDSKPENVMSIDIQQCAIGKSCLILEGFDHMGAGDVDCEEK